MEKTTQNKKVNFNFNNLIINKYNQWRNAEIRKELQNKTNTIAEYIAKNINDFNIKNVSITAEHLQMFDIMAQSIYTAEMLEKWNACGNNKKRNYIINNIMFALRKSKKFDRGASVFNKEAKQYTEKAYTTAHRVHLASIFCGVAYDLMGNTYSIKQ